MTMTTGRVDLSEVIDRIDHIHAEVLATTEEPGGPGGWRHLRDRAVGELTAGLPDVDCGVCIAAAPPIDVPPIDAAADPAAAADSRGRLLTWLAGTREQLRLGRAVATCLSRAHPR